MRSGVAARIIVGFFTAATGAISTAVLPAAAPSQPNSTSQTQEGLPGQPNTAAPDLAGEAGLTGSAAPLTLSESVRYALQSNPQVRAATAQRAMALARLIPLQAGFLPTVDATAYEALQGPRVALPLATGPGVVVPVDQRQASLSAEQILYRPGQSANQKRVAARVASANAAYSDSMAAVIHDVVTAYYGVLQARGADTVARQAVIDVQQSVDQVQVLIKAGQAVQLDLLNAQSSLLQAQQDATTARLGIHAAEAAFNSALGRPLSTPVTLSESDMPGQVPDTLEDATRRALLLRPDIRQAKADLEAARAGLTLARDERGPTISTRASFAVQNPTALQDNTEWTLRAMVSIPVFETAQQRSDVQQAIAGVDAAVAGVDAIHDGVSVEVLKAWDDLQSARSAVDTDTGVVAAQQETLRAVTLRNQVGEATASDIARSRLKLDQAMLAQERDRYNVAMRAVDLQFRMGALAPEPPATPHEVIVLPAALAPTAGPTLPGQPATAGAPTGSERR